MKTHPLKILKHYFLKISRAGLAWEIAFTETFIAVPDLIQLI